MSSPPKHLICFFMVAVGVFLSTMDSSMMNIALPFIMESFSATLGQAELVVLVYLLTITVSLLVWGKISDRIGKGIIYLIGMVVFSLGSLLCYFSSELALLVASRFVQGMGAGMMMSTGPAIIRLVVPAGQIGKWLGSLGISTSMGLMSGPLVGGFIIHNHGFRSIFLLNLPIVAIVFMFGWIFIAGTLPKFKDEKERFDWLGSGMWIVIISILVYLLSTHSSGWNSIKVIAAVLLPFLIFYFINYELKHESPLLPIGLMNKKFYSIGMVSVSLSFCVLFFVLILMPFYLKYIKELSVDKIGYVMMAVPVCLFVVSPLSGRFYDKIGAKYLTSLGLVISGCAILSIALLDETSSIFDICWRLALLGCGQSIFLSPNTASVLSKVSIKDTGITSGMLATCRNLGMLMGVAIVGLLFSSLYGYLSGDMLLKDYSPEYLGDFLKAFKITLILSAITAFFGAILSYRR